MARTDRLKDQAVTQRSQWFSSAGQPPHLDMERLAWRASRPRPFPPCSANAATLRTRFRFDGSMHGWRAYALIACAAACGAAAVCLVAVAIFMDLAVADRLGSVMGAIAGLVGLVISVWALAGSGGRTVEADDGALASGGHVGRVIVGNHNAVTPHAPSHHSPPTSGNVRASGAGSTAAAGDIGEVITGDGNRT